MSTQPRNYCTHCQLVPPRWGDRCRLCAFSGVFLSCAERLLIITIGAIVMIVLAHLVKVK